MYCQRKHIIDTKGTTYEETWEQLIDWEKNNKHLISGTYFLYANKGNGINIWANHEDNGGYDIAVYIVTPFTEEIKKNQNLA